MARRATKFRSQCPINIALELVGDSWSLLIVRDLMFKGCNGYNDFLASGERIATNILADRLGKLEAHGLIAKDRDPDDARKFIYRLTEKGIGLLPMLIEMVLWSASVEDTDAPADILHLMRGDRRRFMKQVRAQWQAAQPKPRQARKAR